MRSISTNNGRLRGWLLAAAICIGVYLATPASGRAEEDHLKGYKIKDLNQVVATNPVTVDNVFGSESCTLKKPQFFLVQGEKNSGDDARGGPAGDFVCYKAKCTGPVPPTTDADSQFGVHKLQTVKAKLVCLPVNPHVCGDDQLDAGETCDGSADAACPGLCQADCTCMAQPCQANTGGFCWFLGAVDQSCAVACTSNGRAYDNATASYAGSGGSIGECVTVLQDLGVDLAAFGDIGCTEGAGCTTNVSSGGGLGGAVRCASPPTTAAAAPDSGYYRACACQ